MTYIEGEKNNLLLVVGSCNHGKHGKEVEVASDLQLLCG